MNALVVEGEWIPCGWCREPILTRWIENGGLLPGDYVLVANWVFHPGCWQQIEDKLDADAP